MYSVLLTACLVSIASSEQIIETSSGPIRSVAALTDDVEAFLGIPYAEPPIGELRFAKPNPKKPWTDIYNASNLPPPCVQYTLGPHYFMPNVTNMSEDCLYLNVWIPKAKSSQKLRPIMFYIHPGGFATGSSNIQAHDGSRLASRGDVVVVTINYRLGALGYFLAFIEEADGNMGIYDQILALKWVKENAEKFGGDPENIVLMGVSAGGISVSLHMLSPLTQNLFKRAIVQSGGMIHPFLSDDNERLFRHSELMASMVGCANKDITLTKDAQSVVKCLKSKSADDLANAEFNLIKTNPIMFVPRVNDTYLPQNTTDLFREGKLKVDFETMIGITKDEGTALMGLLLPEYFGFYGTERTRTINKNLAFVLSMGSVQLFGQQRPTEVVNFYMKQVKNRTADGYSRMVANIIGDAMISCSTVFFADLLSLTNKNVYFYKFEYRSPSTPMAEWMGTTHLDEIQYIFGNPYHTNFTAKEIELSHVLIDRWSAFAKSGIPNIPKHLPWLQYSHDSPIYLNFGEEESIRLNPSDSCEIWRKRLHATIHTSLN